MRQMRAELLKKRQKVRRIVKNPHQVKFLLLNSRLTEGAIFNSPWSMAPALADVYIELRLSREHQSRLQESV